MRVDSHRHAAGPDGAAARVAPLPRDPVHLFDVDAEQVALERHQRAESTFWSALVRERGDEGLSEAARALWRHFVEVLAQRSPAHVRLLEIRARLVPQA